MKRLVCAAALIAFAACHRTEVPLNQFLLHVDGAWVTPPEAGGRNVRTAPATLVAFRDGHEYFEMHFQIIEQPDATLYISSDRRHIAVIGEWNQDGSRLDAVRANVSGACTPMTFQISGKSVVSDGNIYSPVTRLVAPDMQSYIDEAKSSPVKCPQPKT